MKSIYFLPLIIAVSVLNIDFASISDWDTKRESENVKLQYRWVKNQDNREYREFRAVLNISASVKSFLRNMNEEERVSQWTAKSKSCNIFAKTKNEWITYTYFDIPKPFAQQDVVLKHSVNYEKQIIIITLKPLPNYLPKQKNVSRIDEYIGYWKIIPTGINQIKVEFYYTPTEKPILPRFIMDPILQKLLMESFTKLIELSEANC